MSRLVDVRRLFALSAYALVLTGILSLSLAEGSPFWIVFATGFSLFAYYRAEVRKRRIGRLATNVLVVATLAIIPLEALLSARDPVLGLAHFLLAVQVVKLFGQNAPRDYLQLFTVSLMHLGVAAVITIDLAFSIAFVVYMVVGTWTLVLFFLVRELEARAPGDPALVRSSRGLLGATALVAFAALGLTTAFFFLFPRFSAVFFNVRRPSLQRVSGFSTQIGLTDLSSIKSNNERVMQVYMEKRGAGFPDDPKWRGIAFDVYEDGEWRQSWRVGRATRASRLLNPRQTQGKRWQIQYHRPSNGSDPSTYTVWLEPVGIDANILFLAREIDSVEFLSQEQPAALKVDKGEGILGESMAPTQMKYRAVSRIPRREAARGAGFVKPEDGWIDGIDYLSLPRDETLTARLADLAKTVVANAHAATPLEEAEELERYLRTEFKYTVELGKLPRAPAGVDPILHFLFTTKAGHCELSATAFVLMSRTLGLPARLVNGFQTGQWNDMGSWPHYLVRQSDAHAWAEVYFKDVGWIDFDPTPWSSSRSGVLTAFEKMQDYIRLRWLDYVISYSLSDQLSTAERMRMRLEGLRRELKDALKALRAYRPKLTGVELAKMLCAAAGALLVLVGGVAFAVARRKRRLRAKPPARRSAPRPVPFFDELVRILARRGLHRAPAETPREFAGRIAALGGPGKELHGVSVVVDGFYSVRFGQRELAAEERAEVDAALAAIAGTSAEPKTGG